MLGSLLLLDSDCGWSGRLDDDSPSLRILTAMIAQGICLLERLRLLLFGLFGPSAQVTIHRVAGLWPERSASGLCCCLAFARRKHSPDIFERFSEKGPLWGSQEKLQHVAQYTNPQTS